MIRSKEYDRAVDVSVLVPVYNGERYLPRALDSVLRQTVSEIEIIAVDDGSTDGSWDLLRRYAGCDRRLSPVWQENTGIVGALNRGLAEARGEFIARMDADDVCLPQRFEKQLAFMRAHPECVALGTDVLYTDPEGAPLVRHQPALDHGGIMAQLIDGNGGALIHPSTMFRRSAIEKVGGYRQRYQWIEDLDLYLRLSEVGELANLPEVHLHYRQHLRSVNRTRGRREELRREIVNTYRSARQLQEMKEEPVREEEPRSAADWRRHWAFDAARGGHWRSARKNALRAVMMAPWNRSNWGCLRYVRGDLGTADFASV